MAINKAKTSPWMKGFIIFLIVAFVVTIGAASIPSIFTLFTTPEPQTTTSGTVAPTIDQINANYKPGVDALAAAAASSPTSFTAHADLGNAYFDWAQTLITPADGASQVSTASAAAAAPLWLLSKEAYSKAAQIKPGDPALETDWSIVTFYSGDTSSAVLIAEKVTTKTPTFPQAWRNLGIFYADSGQTDKAISAFERYIKLDPKGQDVAFAQDQIKTLKAAKTTP